MSGEIATIIPENLKPYLEQYFNNPLNDTIGDIPAIQKASEIFQKFTDGEISREDTGYLLDQLTDLHPQIRNYKNIIGL